MRSCLQDCIRINEIGSSMKFVDEILRRQLIRFRRRVGGIFLRRRT